MTGNQLSTLQICCFAFSLGVTSPSRSEPVVPAAFQQAIEPRLRVQPEQQISPLLKVARVYDDLRRQLRSLNEQHGAIENELTQIQALRTHLGKRYVKKLRLGIAPWVSGYAKLSEHARQLTALNGQLERLGAQHRRLTEQLKRLAITRAELSQRCAALEGEKLALEQAQAVVQAAQDREMAFQRAFQSSNFDGHSRPSSSAHTAVYGAHLAAAGENDEPLALQRGRLAFPLAGRSELKRVRRAGAGGVGLELVARLGTWVHAVAAGRVAFADEYPEYGNTVIIDHGDRYFSVSAHLADIVVRVGDAVFQGTRVGTVGANGQGSLLYFELRQGTRTLDPAPWFGL